MLSQLIQQYEDGNKTRFAKRLGLTPQGISTWLSRGTIDYELVYANCEGLDAAWLLTGEGSMLRKDVPTPCAPASAPSDAVTMRLMDKLDKKEAQIDQLQSELRVMTEELATLKAKYPHESPPSVAIEELHEVLGSPRIAKHANTKPHSSTSVPSAGSVQPHQENQ